MLGIAGTTFAVGIPFVSAWYGAARKGFATGVFGAGMGGTALSSFFTPRFVDWFGYTMTHVIIAVALAITGFVVLSVMRDSPRWRPNNDPAIPKLVAASKLPVTWQLSFLYAVTFGGFVAFTTYLPTYLNDIYDFNLTEAGTRTAGFALAAVIARPIGGTLSDRLHPKPVVLTSLAGAAVMSLVIATQPAPELAAGASFVTMAFLLGIGTGGVFAWVAKRAPAERIGTVAGIVGAAGGLGGFFPPLVMGATYDEAGNDYTIGLGLLCVTALVALAFTAVVLRREQAGRAGRRLDGLPSVREVNRARALGAHLDGDRVEHVSGNARVDGQRHQRLAALLVARDLHAGDVDAAPRRAAGRRCRRRPAGRRSGRTPCARSAARSTSKPSTSTSFSVRRGPTSVPETETTSPLGQRAAHGDQVAVVGALVAGGESDLDAALLGEQRRVDVGHGLLDDVGEHALERGQLEHLDVVRGDLAAHLDVESGWRRRRRAR